MDPGNERNARCKRGNPVPLQPALRRHLHGGGGGVSPSWPGRLPGPGIETRLLRTRRHSLRPLQPDEYPLSPNPPTGRVRSLRAHYQRFNQSNKNMNQRAWPGIALRRLEDLVQDLKFGLRVLLKQPVALVAAM